MNAILLITKGLELVDTIGPIALVLAQQIKRLLEVDGDFAVQLKTLHDQATDANTAALQMIADWKASHL